MSKNFFTVSVVFSLALLVGCATVKGTVFKTKDGNYQATFSDKNERDALKVVHNDAKITCDDATGKKDFVVVDQKIETMTEKTEGTKEGFAAVAGSAVTALDKYFGSENVRATLIFNCGS